MSLLPAGARETQRWSDWQLYASTGFVIAAVVTLVVIWMLRKHVAGSWSALGLSSAAAVAAVVALWTRPLVQWDQLALWAVTTGTNADGYWYAAFNDEVRFVLVDGAEISQGQYAPAAVAHLVAPFLGAVALTAACVVLIRRAARR